MKIKVAQSMDVCSKINRLFLTTFEITTFCFLVNGRPVDYVSGTLLVTLLTAVTILLVLLGICLVSMRQRAPPPAITTVPPPTLLQSHPDRLALIAFTDAVQVGQVWIAA